MLACSLLCNPTITRLTLFSPGFDYHVGHQCRVSALTQPGSNRQVPLILSLMLTGSPREILPSSVLRFGVEQPCEPPCLLPRAQEAPPIRRFHRLSEPILYIPAGRGEATLAFPCACSPKKSNNFL